jgi:hypothetical protein
VAEGNWLNGILVAPPEAQPEAPTEPPAATEAAPAPAEN